MVVFVFYFSGFLFSQSQSAVSISKKLSVIETEYFDIIFTEESTESAKYLAQHADVLYIKAKDFLKVEKVLRIPVVLSQQTDVLNGYFTFVPYSRIVIYDTLPQTSLAVFDDTLLSVFYHELIHAISFRVSIGNSRLWNNFHSYCTSLDMPTSITEGTAVLAESLDGYGRLNSAYSMHVVRQAKIENKFPHWSDITGSYTLYTDGSLPYIFGGAFMQYMYEQFGAQSLADFWNESNDIDLISYTQNFKKVYGITIEKAWNDFENSIVVSPTIEMPTISIAEKYLYQNLTSSPFGIAWQDGFTGNVYFLDYNETRESFLFSSDLNTSLSFSRDGKFLVISGATGLETSQNITRIYDMEKKRFIKSQRDIRDAAIISINASLFNSERNDTVTQEYVLAGIETNGQRASLVLYDATDTKNSIELDRFDFNFGTIPFTPVDIGDGVIVMLLKASDYWGFFTYNVYTKETKTYRSDLLVQNPSELASLFAGKTKAFFSYAQTPESQPLLASIDLSQFSSNSFEARIYTTEVSGGIFNPIENFNDNDIAHISRFYESRAISTLELSEQKYRPIEFYEYIQEKDIVIQDQEIKQYHVENYLSTGVVIPFVGSVNLTPIDERVFSLFSIGITGFTIDPAERLLLIGGTGWDPFTKNTTTTLSAYFTEQNSSIINENHLATSFEGIESFGSMVQMDVSIPIFSDFNRVGVLNSSRFFYFKDDNEFYKKGNTIDNISSLYYQNLRKAGSGFYETLGLFLQYSFQLEKYFGDAPYTSNELYYGHILHAKVYIPRLLPFQNPNRFSVNLPFSLEFSYFNRFTALWEAGTNVVLFSYDIQDALSFMHLFFQRVTLDTQATYTKYKEIQDTFILTTSLFTSATINIGILTNSPVDIGVSVLWEPFISGKNAVSTQLKFDVNL